MWAGSNWLRRGSSGGICWWKNRDFCKTVDTLKFLMACPASTCSLLDSEQWRIWRTLKLTSPTGGFAYGIPWKAKISWPSILVRYSRDKMAEMLRLNNIISIWGIIRQSEGVKCLMGSLARPSAILTARPCDEIWWDRFLTSSPEI